MAAEDPSLVETTALSLGEESLPPGTADGAPAVCHSPPPRPGQGARRNNDFTRFANENLEAQRG